MFSNASSWARLGLGLVVAFVAAAAAQAKVIDITINESRGVDPRVNYSRLTDYGPWDDRNYALTAEDLKSLSPNETESHDPTPAFFRVDAQGSPARRPSAADQRSRPISAQRRQHVPAAF
jgi:hypothetical protein